MKLIAYCFSRSCIEKYLYENHAAYKYAFDKELEFQEKKKLQKYSFTRKEYSQLETKYRRERKEIYSRACLGEGARLELDKKTHDCPYCGWGLYWEKKGGHPWEGRDFIY